jgi:hypothetical protein
MEKKLHYYRVGKYCNIIIATYKTLKNKEFKKELEQYIANNFEENLSITKLDIPKVYFYKKLSFPMLIWESNRLAS